MRFLSCEEVPWEEVPREEVPWELEQVVPAGGAATTAPIISATEELQALVKQPTGSLLGPLPWTRTSPLRFTPFRGVQASHQTDPLVGNLGAPVVSSLQ